MIFFHFFIRRITWSFWVAFGSLMADLHKTLYWGVG